MHIQLCRSIRTNGLQCRAAALTGAPLCYFHTRLHQGHARYRQTAASRLYLDLPPGQNIELGPLEDRESIQIAISQVINALATGQLDPKRATALLYGLQLASSNAAHLHTQPHATTGIRTLETTPEESALPGLDLAQPGAIYDTEPPLETFDDEQEEDEDEEYEQEIEDRVNERLAEIEAAKLNEKVEEQPETIPTIQAVAQLAHSSNLIPHSRKLGAPFMTVSPSWVGIAQSATALSQTTNPARQRLHPTHRDKTAMNGAPRVLGGCD